MRGFGIGLRAARSSRRVTQREIARIVLGDADERKIADFANYMSRVERETRDARNPSLSLLEQYADGLGIRLSTMFSEIEAVADRLNVNRRETVLQSVGNTPIVFSPQEPQQHAVAGRGNGSGSVPTTVYQQDIARLQSSISAIEAELRRERERVARLAASIERPANPRRKRTGRG